ncbi:MAG: glycosyl hydrolase family 8 [Alphaproteobacteria bacterium]
MITFAKGRPALAGLAALLALGLILGSALPAPASAQSLGQFKRQWGQYKQQFMLEDGRILDTGNENVSHTEGQGTGMLFAVFANDQASFDMIWNWTRGHLRRRDRLFSWKWDVNHPQGPVPDPNNATDGDLLISWALLLGAELWQSPAYQASADEIIQSLERLVLDRFAGRVLVLPGVQGFRNKGVRILNPSYCLFPALDAIAAHTGRPIWTEAYRGCLSLVRSASFGDQRLPVDWIALTSRGTLTPAPDWPTRFGYDAIRVPLYLAWGGHKGRADLERFADAWSQVPRNAPPPSWIDPITGETARYRASNGFLATRQLVRFALYLDDQRLRDAEAVRFPTISRFDDYYSASLLMFSSLAAMTMAL